MRPLVSMEESFFSADLMSKYTPSGTKVLIASTTKAEIMKGTKVQTLGARAVAGAWCMAGCLGHNYYYGHGCNY